MRTMRFPTFDHSVPQSRECPNERLSLIPVRHWGRRSAPRCGECGAMLSSREAQKPPIVLRHERHTLTLRFSAGIGSSASTASRFNRLATRAPTFAARAATRRDRSSAITSTAPSARRKFNGHDWKGRAHAHDDAGSSRTPHDAQSDQSASDADHHRHERALRRPGRRARDAAFTDGGTGAAHRRPSSRPRRMAFSE